MATVTEEKIDLAPELLEQINTQEEKQVIVHAKAKGIPNVHTIRVWPTIYLIPKGTSHKCKLLHHFNIVMYPKWQPIGPSGQHSFTLLFEGLPADCTTFDIVEIIDEEGAFEYRNMPRNVSDVYHVTF
ncbi:hypothetical protein [Flavobacterium haoranii]|uniref:Uncharacterized protein n=1 Tax=Flavobacterium haoranii TaxID=683124 RepID=A0A1M6C509_9FLAO|nr:hypothetical protein [Flavobacterium haoranii]SHI56106.1 hypothetical protein SAMN05444337_0282 [Flavobacterium haoranii]